LHEGVRSLVRDLNFLYCDRPALHAGDCDREGFEWLIVDDAENSVFAWLRRAPGEKPIAVIVNMTPQLHVRYRVPLPQDGVWHELINTDATVYGGSGEGNMGLAAAKDGYAWLLLPPLATLQLEPAG
jgi:1,4-alpha-glucan branching enzyme